MKHLFLLVFWLCSVSLSMAQTKTIFNIDQVAGKKDRVALMVNDKEEYLFAHKGDGFTDLYFLDKNNKPKKKERIGVIPEFKKITLFRYFERDGKLHMIGTQTIEGTEYLTVIKQTEAKEMRRKPVSIRHGSTNSFLGNFYHKDSLITASIDKENILHVAITNFDKVDRKSIPLNSDLKLKKLLKNKRSMEAGLSTIASMNYNDFVETTPHNKVYFNYPDLFIVHDGSGQTTLIRTNVLTEETESLNFPYNHQQLMTNSVLHGNELWQYGALGQSMHLKAINIDTEKTIFEEAITAKTINKFSVDKYYQVGSQFDGQNAEKTWTKYSDFVKRAKTGQPTIAMSSTGDELVLKVGAFREVTSGPAFIMSAVGMGLSAASNGQFWGAGGGTVGKEYFFYLPLKKQEDTYLLAKEIDTEEKFGQIREAFNYYQYIPTRKKGIFRNSNTSETLIYWLNPANGQEVIFKYY